jgi:lantibiotic modifying enzyme
MSVPAQTFLETADFLGARLCREAIWSGDRCNWVGPVANDLNGRSTLVYLACGPDLHGGTSGIAIFLARLFAVTRERVFRLTAEAAMRQALSRLDDLPRDVRIGFYEGLTGVAFALSELSELLEIPKFAPIALLLLDEVQKDLQAPELDCEPAAGNAGMSLIRRYEFYGDADCLNQIREHAQKVERDLCTALPADFSLAAGATGKAEFLLEASRVLSEDSYSQAAERVGQSGIDRFRKDDLAWPCAGPDNPESPGLMYGLAGIGHFYLRLFDPHRTPSLLMLRAD